MFRGSIFLRYSQISINPVVKTFMVAEMLLWSAWNFITPIFAVFVTAIPNGTVETAASAFSTYLVVRVIFELTSGKYLSKASDVKKFWITIIGMLIISLSYVGFAITSNIFSIFLFYAVLGIGLGIASPAKNSLFSTHLDKSEETIEWGILDATTFLSMAVSSVIGGFIAKNYGFPILFLVAATINAFGIIPYFIYLKQLKKVSYTSH